MTHYRQIYYEALNCLIKSLNEHFIQPSFVAYKMRESSLLKYLADEDLENCYLLQTKKKNILKVIMTNETIVCFDDILQCLKNQSNQLIVMPNIIKVLKSDSQLPKNLFCLLQ